jgi:FkbM family methyltransferase
MNQFKFNLPSPLTDKPDAWIYNYPVLKWMFEPSLGKQLPPQYQIFRTYAYWYFKLTGQTYLSGGRELFQFLAHRLSKKSGDREYKFHLPNCDIYVDRFDARFFKVIDELTDPKSDLLVLPELLSTGDTFIDVGANHGSFSIAASKLVGKTGRAVAVEAQPHLAKMVEKSLSINAPCNFRVYPVAVGDREGEVEFLIPQGTSGSAGLFEEHSATAKFSSIKVPIKRFDDLVEWQSFLGRTLIKLDIEGSETAFLLGASKMIRALKPTLIIEIHPGTLKASKNTGEDLKRLLQDLGCDRYAEMDNLKNTFPLEHLNTQVQRNVVIY